MSQENTKNEKKNPMIPNQTKNNSNKVTPAAEPQKMDWGQVKIAAKKSWGNLTDEDFKKAGGSVEKLCDVIHERFGDSPDSIKAVLSHKPQGENSQARSTSPYPSK
jgi:uncharacterized protein YjbJ (UPF0337 family)